MTEMVRADSHGEIEVANVLNSDEKMRNLHGIELSGVNWSHNTITAVTVFHSLSLEASKYGANILRDHLVQNWTLYPTLLARPKRDLEAFF